jgi:hypothetical protein
MFRSIGRTCDCVAFLTQLRGEELEWELEMQDGACRRLAVQLASQLPEDRDAALKTLEYLQEVVDTFLLPPQIEVAGNVLRFAGPVSGAVAD